MVLQDNDLKIILTEGRINIIRWSGKSDAREPSSLITPFFTDIIELLKGKELEMQFQELKYMNSSTVQPIIQIMKDLERNGIKSTITYDKNMKWQAASFKALENIARDMHYITIRGV